MTDGNNEVDMSNLFDFFLNEENGRLSSTQQIQNINTHANETTSIQFNPGLIVPHYMYDTSIVSTSRNNAYETKLRQQDAHYLAREMASLNLIEDGFGYLRVESLLPNKVCERNTIWDAKYIHGIKYVCGNPLLFVWCVMWNQENRKKEVWLSNEMMTGKMLILLLERAGLSTHLSYKKKKDFEGPFLEYIIKHADEVEIPERHGWHMKKNGTLGFANRTCFTMKEVLKKCQNRS